MFGWRRRKRARLRKQPVPFHWVSTLEGNVPYYRILPPEDRSELMEHMLVFLDEKNFEGCAGLELTEDMRLTIAAHACILLLHRDTEYYPRLCSILVYPRAFTAETTTRGPGRTFVVGEETRVGESWNTGAVIFAWDDVQHSFRHHHDGHNVLFHEFAHQVDQENGESDGFPPMAGRELARAWGRVMSAEYQRLQEDVERGRGSFIDAYGAKSPAEFFAVATECFFEMPAIMKRLRPELYEVLAAFYDQDPAALLERVQTGWPKG